MASINDIVTVTVINNAKGITHQGFGTMLFITDIVPEKFDSKVRLYKSADELLKDGFDDKNHAYTAALCYFGQEPSPSELLVAPVQKGENKTDWSKTLLDISNVNDTWYALATYSHDDTDILELAKLIEAKKRFYCFSSSEASIKTEVKTDIFSLLNSYSRTSGLYSNEDSKFPECGWFGSGMALDAGTATYCFKDIIGITPDNLTSTESSNIDTKNGNTYETIAGVNLTRYGKVTNGNYIDIVMGIDYISSEIQSQILSVLKKNLKLPYTDHGITCIQNQITGVLNTAMSKDIIAKYDVKMPKAQKITPDQKATRKLSEIFINLTMSGAIQHVDVQIIYQL